jgi:polyhydroxybutyrate depolymerase
MQNIDDVGFVRALIAKFRADYGINPSRVFAMGMSNGGQMVYRLAAALPDEITGIAAVGVNLPTDDNDDCRALGKPIPVLIIMGTSDPMLPYNGGNSSDGNLRSAQASAEFFAKLNGHANPPKTTRLPHLDSSDSTSVDRTIWSDAGKPEVVLDTINGGGHVLPLSKFSTVYYYGLNFGQTTGDLDAPAEIWEFFGRQPSLK